MTPVGIQGLGAIQTGRVHEEVTAFSALQVLSSLLYLLLSTQFLILSQRVLSQSSLVRGFYLEESRNHIFIMNSHMWRIGFHPLFVPPESPP
jgi:hypothetical protein